MDGLVDILFWLGLFVTIGYCYWLRHSCEHEWKTEEKVSVWGSGQSTVPNAIIYVLRCEKCGKIKQQRISG